MDEWLLETEPRWVLCELMNKGQERAVVVGFTTRNGDLKIPMYESEEKAWKATARMEKEVVPVRLSPAVPHEE